MVERTVVEKTVVERTVVERTSGGKHLSPSYMASAMPMAFSVAMSHPISINHSNISHNVIVAIQ